MSGFLKGMFDFAHNMTAKTGLVAPVKPQVTIGNTVVPLETAAMFLKYGQADGMSPLVHNTDDVLKAIRKVVDDEQKVQAMIKPAGRIVSVTPVKRPEIEMP